MRQRRRFSFSETIVEIFEKIPEDPINAFPFAMVFVVVLLLSVEIVVKPIYYYISTTPEEREEIEAKKAEEEAIAEKEKEEKERQKEEERAEEEAKEKEALELKLDTSYKLVSATYEITTQTNINVSGYLFFAYKAQAEINEENNRLYRYYYKRKDGGILEKTIDYRDFEHPEDVKVVVYEDDTQEPKLEIWRNEPAKENGDGSGCGDGLIQKHYEGNAKTEYRFTIPSGNFVNVYNLQQKE